MKTFITLMLTLSVSAIFAQTKNNNLDAELQTMKRYFLAEDYDNFANYTYPKILELMGGKSTMVQATKQSMTQIKSEGFSIIDLKFKDVSNFLEKDGELQCTLRQLITMKTPKGTIASEYTLIGISEDKGVHWTFMDTSGKSKETMLKYFPNLHPNLIIKPKTQRFIE